MVAPTRLKMTIDGEPPGAAKTTSKSPMKVCVPVRSTDTLEIVLITPVTAKLTIVGGPKVPLVVVSAIGPTPVPGNVVPGPGVGVTVGVGVPVGVGVGVGVPPPPVVSDTSSTRKLSLPVVPAGRIYVNRITCDAPLANAEILTVRSV